MKRYILVLGIFVLGNSSLFSCCRTRSSSDVEAHNQATSQTNLVGLKTQVPELDLSGVVKAAKGAAVATALVAASQFTDSAYSSGTLVDPSIPLLTTGLRVVAGLWGAEAIRRFVTSFSGIPGKIVCCGRCAVGLRPRHRR